MTERPPASSVHPATGSPDRIALADYDANLPDTAATALISAHVEGCADCQAVLSALRATRSDLTQLAGTPMPAAVADRIAAALAAERRTSTAADAEAGRHRAAQVIELRPARSLGWLRAAAGLAAGIVLLGGGGYLLVNGTGAGGGDTGASLAEGADEEAAPQADSGGEALRSFDRQSLEAAVDELLRDAALSRSGEPEIAEGGQSAATDVSQECLTSIPVATAQALVVTRVVYQDRPAIVVLFAGAPGQVQVTVFSDCAEGVEPGVVDAFTADR